MIDERTTFVVQKITKDSFRKGRYLFEVTKFMGGDEEKSLLNVDEAKKYYKAGRLLFANDKLRQGAINILHKHIQSLGGQL